MNDQKVNTNCVEGTNFTLGRVAYEAYCKACNNRSLVSDKPLPSFYNTTPEIQFAWIQAAKAVKNTM